MDLQNRRQELSIAWRALHGLTQDAGWRTINVTNSGSIEVRAGRHFPGNEEAILFNFKSLMNNFHDLLPEGQGFLVSHEKLSLGDINSLWIALSKQSEGNLDFFTMMVEDILISIEKLAGRSNETIFQLFIDRIIAWQDFMKKNKNGHLSKEEEVGLFGELELLGELIKKSYPRVVKSWRGPLGGAQDFFFKDKAVEVKSTISQNRFLAQISSLTQLDLSYNREIYLACFNLAEDVNGMTLTQKISEINELFSNDNEASFVWSTCLLQAGYKTEDGQKYVRRFNRQKLRIYEVDNSFPKLTSSTVPFGIKKAQYEIDIDSLKLQSLELRDLLNNLEL
jgi:hypothetical protein